MNSTLWIVYARTGREFDVEEQAHALGIDAVVPRRVDIIRRGKRRWPDAIESPFLPNYVFVWMTDEEWHLLRDIKEVASIMSVIPQYEPVIRRFVERIEDDYEARMAQIAAGQRVAEYEPDDVLTIISGPLQGQMARFRRMVERADELFPKIAADMELMGRIVPVEIDPLDARKLAAE